MNSRTKGARGELEIAHKLQKYGYAARRGQQYSGANGDADVIGLPGIHIEVKRREILNLYDSLDQSKRDARNGELPVVFHRKNGEKWVAIMDFDDWMALYKGATDDRVD